MMDRFLSFGTLHLLPGVAAVNLLPRDSTGGDDRRTVLWIAA